jgi:hypothetical protein
MLERIQAFDRAEGGGILVERVNKGYSAVQWRNRRPGRAAASDRRPRRRG